jgi:hypothetical protein
MRGVVERPTGFRYLPSLLSEDQERDLLEQVRDRQFDEVRLHGHVARRAARWNRSTGPQDACGKGVESPRCLLLTQCIAD